MKLLDSQNSGTAWIFRDFGHGLDRFYYTPVQHGCFTVIILVSAAFLIIIVFIIYHFNITWQYPKKKN